MLNLTKTCIKYFDFFSYLRQTIKDISPQISKRKENVKENCERDNFIGIPSTIISPQIQLNNFLLNTSYNSTF